MKYSIETIKKIVSRNPETAIVYFWRHIPDPNKMTAACLSQWYDCCFCVNGVKYHTAEQYMMAGKAKLFKDDEICGEIMTASTSQEYKSLGRKIRDFNQELWDAHKFDIVVEGNKAKFSQNPDLKDFLLSTGDAILVEASPYDKIWGIGLDRESAQMCSVEQWQGENLLGCALMEVRDWLSELSKQDSTESIKRTHEYEFTQPSVTTCHRNLTWDSERDFLEKYHSLMVKIKGGDQYAYSQLKDLRVKEFRSTIDIVNRRFYVTESGRKVVFPNDADMINHTCFYSREIRLNEIPEGEQTCVEVKNIDCLYAGLQLKRNGYNPAVLNMASRRNPGGGVLTGAGAQEETLFRRTNLFRSLYQFAPFAHEYGITQSYCQYPLDRNYGGIYTPGAICFRDNEQRGYALLDKPFSLSFISVAGMNRPDLIDGGLMIAHHLVEPIKNKIRTIFRIGLEHGHDSLVLGALGCGAFCNPPRHIARLFHMVMEEPEFRNRYSKIVFAIIDDHNAHHSHNPEGNFKPFADEFVGMDI